MPQTLNVALKNDSDLDNIHAYITGNAIQHGGKRCLLTADGKDLYFPSNPPAIGSPLTEDCAIPLGRPGNTVHVTVPQIAGGRIWIVEGRLTFLLNPGPALVEPSVLNPRDPNAGVNFTFCEFTLYVRRLSELCNSCCESTSTPFIVMNVLEIAYGLCSLRSC